MIRKENIACTPSALKQSGVESSVFTTDTLAIREMTGWKISRLHVLPRAEQPDFASIELPKYVGECLGTSPVVLCLRPREWLFLDHSAEASEAPAWEQKENGSAFWSDLSDGLTVFRIEGAGAPWLLNKVSGLDYQSWHAAAAHCARTRMGQIAVVVHFHRTPDDGDVFDLVVDRSIARYVWELLCASAPHANDLARATGPLDLT